MKERHAINSLIYAALIVISAIVGWQTTYLIDMLPFNMPDSVEAFIRFWLSCTGTEYLGNPDDMEVLALLLYWSIVTLLTGLALSGLKRWLSRCLISRKTHAAIPRLPLFVKLVACSLTLLVISDIGLYLSSPFTRSSIDMPLPVRALIRFFRSVTGPGSGAGNDDMVLSAMYLYWAVASLIVGALFILFYIVARGLARRLIRRKPSHE